jgi:hypothetical protein
VARTVLGSDRRGEFACGTGHPSTTTPAACNRTSGKRQSRMPDCFLTAVQHSGTQQRVATNKGIWPKQFPRNRGAGNRSFVRILCDTKKDRKALSSETIFCLRNCGSAGSYAHGRASSFWPFYSVGRRCGFLRMSPSCGITWMVFCRSRRNRALQIYSFGHRFIALGRGFRC